MHAFRMKNGRLPKPWSNSDAENFLRLAKGLNAASPSPIEIQGSIVELFSKTCAGNLVPMVAVIGGTTSQEVLKAVSGCFLPIKQWLYFDARECLPEDLSSLTEESCQPIGSRYDGQIAVFGQDVQEKIFKQRFLLEGCGGVNSEFIQTFSLMGLGASPEGKMFVCEKDPIERSNLRRQFLDDWQRSSGNPPEKPILSSTLKNLLNMNDQETLKYYFKSLVINPSF
jgi:hypothetical protein